MGRAELIEEIKAGRAECPECGGGGMSFQSSDGEWDTCEMCLGAEGPESSPGPSIELRRIFLGDPGQLRGTTVEVVCLDEAPQPEVVEALASPLELHRSGPVPEVVALLEMMLKRAQDGEVRAVAVATSDGDGGTWEAVELGTGRLADLVFSLRCAEHRIMRDQVQWDDDHG